MNAEFWAALGCRRGEGESLASWLRAGPLGGHAFKVPKFAPQIAGELYCPACHIDEEGRRRWYTRDAWGLEGVVCTTHHLPLQRFDAPPARLHGRHWPPRLRDEFRALGAWSQQGNGGEVGRAITRAICARSDPRVAYSCAWAAAQWHLWAAGWPVPFAPRPSSFGWLVPRFQFDRLALAAIARRVFVALEDELDAGWGALPIRARVLMWLEGRVGRLRHRVARCFRNADSTRRFV